VAGFLDTFDIDARGPGSSRQDPEEYEALARFLDGVVANGMSRNQARTGVLTDTALVAWINEHLGSSPRQREAGATLMAYLREVTKANEPIATAYQALNELATKARATASVLRETEPLERSWRRRS
jgi:hypothetical protein